MENLKLHGKVRHGIYGIGEVVIIDMERIRPICVIFEGGVCIGFKKNEASILEKLPLGDEVIEL